MIADMEAGIGIFTRMKEGAFDLGVIVTDSSKKAIEVARRARDLISQEKLGPIVIVANKVRDERDIELIVEGLSIPSADLVVVPEDDVVARADRDGISPLDAGAESPAVRAIQKFARRFSPQ